MVKPVIVKRNTKGSALTFSELDTNFQNLDDATISIAVQGGDTVVNDLNDTTTFIASDGLSITAVPSSQSITFDASLVQDPTPQLAGNLDVQTYKITTSVTNGNIEIDPPGAGKVIISGDLQVDGTTTTINSTTLDVDDKNITLAKGAADAAAADGGGITVEGPATAATILYESTDDSWNLNKLTNFENNVRIAGGVTSADYLQFDGAATNTLAAGKMWYDSATGSFNLGMGNGNITQQIGEEFFIYGKASAAITEEQLIKITGTVGASGVVTFAPTTTNMTDSNLIIGVATENIALNGFGRVTQLGVVRGITTTGTSVGETWADGDVLWYNPSYAGGMTKVKPSAPNIKVQIATIINAGSGGSGSLTVSIHPGSSLGETDDNVLITSPQDGDTLVYVGSSQLWVNGPGGKSYTLSAESTSSGDAFIALNGSDSTVDMVEIAAGTGITVTKTDASTITVSRQVYTWDSLGALTWDDLG